MDLSSMDLQSLVHHFYRGPIPTERKLRPLYGALLLYVFRGCKQQQIRNLIDHHQFDFDFLSWRRNLHHMGFLLREVKLWSYWYHSRGQHLRELKLSRGGINAVKSALEFKPLQRHFSYLSEYGAEPLSNNELDQLILDSLYSSDVKAFMGSLVREKMSFLITSFGFTHRDLMCELQLNSLVALLKSYPRFEDVGHMRAICKSSAHNHCINFIHSNTTDSRQRLRKNEDGTHSNLMVPIDMYGADQVFSGEDGVASVSLVSGIDGVSSSQWEQMFALREVMESNKLTESHRRFLRLALGTPDGEFSEFLGMPNDEACESRRYPDYLSSVCKFMGLSQSRMYSFLTSLRGHL